MKSIIVFGAGVIIGVTLMWLTAIHDVSRYEFKTVAGVPVRTDKVTGKAEIVTLELPQH